jgi:hypothetical protein
MTVILEPVRFNTEVISSSPALIHRLVIGGHFTSQREGTAIISYFSQSIP